MRVLGPFRNASSSLSGIPLLLVDLTVLNLFNEYWDFVYFEYFTISLLTAVLLQFLLQVTIAIEHRVRVTLKQKPV